MFKKLYTLVFALPLTALCFSSCGKIASYSPPREHMFVTGECLSDAELTYYMPDDPPVSETIYTDDAFFFGFSLNLTDTQEERVGKGIIKNFRSVLRVIPSDKLFKAFGNHRKAVKAEFENIYECLGNDRAGVVANWSTSTILYDGGIRLTASRDFAGHAAGENLGPYLIPMGSEAPWNWNEKTLISKPWNSSESISSVFGMPLDFGCMLEDGVSFALPFNGCELVEETTTFELEIPVKVVLYLNWLNDRIGRPDAPVPYREEVLRCRFQTRYSLR